MEPVFATLLIVIVVALIFDYINGFHDTANAIPTPRSWGSRSPIPSPRWSTRRRSAR